MDYFSDIVGQVRPIKVLESSINNSNIIHAYLFLGPAGVGKMLSALAFAHTIILEADRQSELYFKEGLHPDLLIIEKIENKTVISKEQVSKEIEPWLGLKPYRARHRIVIIRDAHLMSLEAANALLKTLEEPPEYAIIILVSDESKLLETIISRCQLIRFSFLSDQDIEKYLLGRGYTQKQASQAAKFGQGSISTALRYLEEEDFGSIWKIAVEIVRELASGEYIEIFKSAEKMEKEPALLSNIIETILRDVCIYQETSRKDLLSIPDSIEIASTIKKIDSQRLMRALGKITTIRSYYRRNVNPLLINANISFEVWEALK